MAFKVNARTILHLGAELISSDAIAFYELIKNAFDAKSKRVKINVVIRLSRHSEVLASVRSDAKASQLAELRARVGAAVDLRAPGAVEFRTQVAGATSLGELARLTEEANAIEFEDTGEGMSLSDLDRAYLTIGTRDRLQEREQQRRNLEKGSEDVRRPVLGEKGVGRLSAMRLGRRLSVRTSRAGEAHWNVLEIDWGWFSHDSDKLLEEIPVDPTKGAVKDSSNESGTTIRITALNAEWTATKLEEIAAKEFSKLTDPFLPKTLYPISLRFNGEPVVIRRLSDVIFDEAHAVVDAGLSFDDDHLPRLITQMEYRRYHKTKTVREQGAHLLGLTGLDSTRVLRDLGPFTMRMYWFNRRILTAIEGIGDLSAVRELVALWSGGLMVYRDGFRVYPYGGPDDDWLDLDRKAFGSGGYKVNRAQIVGKVDISALHNPRLTDQTNREGLRECPEAEGLRTLLKHVLRQQFKPFLDAVDEAEKNKERLNFADIESRVEEQERRLQQNIRELALRHPALRDDPRILKELTDTSKRIREIMDQASVLAQSFEKGRIQLVHLAGLGLMVEIVAHELNRATSNTLATVADARSRRGGVSLDEFLPALESQLKTLQKRLRVLDPLTMSGRQVKESFDVVDVVVDVVKGHSAQFRRHSLDVIVRVRPEDEGTLRVKMVRGMVIQVLENLLANSVYWLRQQERLDPAFAGMIRITVDTIAKQIRVRDNGPGVDPDRREDIFEAFVTTKPPGEGKGLGLYIAREIAAYHGAELYMSDRRFPHKNRLNTFVFALEQK